MSTLTQNFVPPPQMWIGGAWVSGGDLHPVLNPANETVIGEVPFASEDDAVRALEAARTAQPGWARHSMVERGAVLRAIASGIRQDSEALAQLVVAEQGKTITEARGEIAGTAEFFDYYATFARSQVGTSYAPDGRGEQLTIKRVPYGVVVGIIPWNFPAALFARKVAPAIMAGNAIVLKPSEETPLTALALARIVERAGIPPGVVNVVTGSGRGAGDALVRHPITQLVTVTGSVRAGQEILAASAEHITTVSLELGGKAPFVVMEDADLGRAIEDAVEARLWNCGQVCTCNERTYVHRSLLEEFVTGVVERARAVRLGDPADSQTQMGPKINGAELAKVQAFVDGAVAEGAELRLGGGRPEGEAFRSGHWFEPTVLTDTRNDMDIVQQEVFGPVLPIMAFDEADEGFALANDSRYGLTAYVYTSDLRLAMRAVDELHAGEVYINKIGPEQLQGFHGGYGLSGLGGDDGEHGFDRYHRRKTVYLRYEE
jgi:lactaldehyde dehydrogenase/glycolaldehyde dehydrogenase